MAFSKARCGRRAGGVCGVRVQWYQSVEEWWIVARTRSLGWGRYCFVLGCPVLALGKLSGDGVFWGEVKWVAVEWRGSQGECNTLPLLFSTQMAFFF